jgi:hypothetical protein
MEGIPGRRASDVCARYLWFVPRSLSIFVEYDAVRCFPPRFTDNKVTQISLSTLGSSNSKGTDIKISKINVKRALDIEFLLYSYHLMIKPSLI